MYLCLGYAWVCHQALALVLRSSNNVCFVHLLLSTSFVVTTPEQQQVKAQYSPLQWGPWMADFGERNLDFSSGPSCVPVGLLGQVLPARTHPTTPAGTQWLAKGLPRGSCVAPQEVPWGGWWWVSDVDAPMGCRAWCASAYLWIQRSNASNSRSGGGTSPCQ